MIPNTKYTIAFDTSDIIYKANGTPSRLDILDSCNQIQPIYSLSNIFEIMPKDGLHESWSSFRSQLSVTLDSIANYPYLASPLSYLVESDINRLLEINNSGRIQVDYRILFNASDFELEMPVITQLGKENNQLKLSVTDLKKELENSLKNMKLINASPYNPSNRNIFNLENIADSMTSDKSRGLADEISLEIYKEKVGFNQIKETINNLVKTTNKLKSKIQSMPHFQNHNNKQSRKALEREIPSILFTYSMSIVAQLLRNSNEKLSPISKEGLLHKLNNQNVLEEYPFLSGIIGSYIAYALYRLNSNSKEKSGDSLDLIHQGRAMGLSAVCTDSKISNPYESISLFRPYKSRIISEREICTTTLLDGLITLNTSTRWVLDKDRGFIVPSRD